MSILQYILKDLREPVLYLPAGIMVGLALYLLANICCGLYGRWKNSTGGSEQAGCSQRNPVLLFLIGVYVYMMLQQSFFSRLPGSRTAVNLVFMGTWGESPQARAYVMENVLMFIPYGLLFPLLLKGPVKRLGHKGLSGLLCVLSAALFSMLLEAAQYVTSRGFCQLDDVVMNTLGAFLGWLLFCCLLRVLRCPSS